MINKNLRKTLTAIKKFRDDRDWKQFHTAKDMASAISIEASELLELFLWKKNEEIEELLRHPEAEYSAEESSFKQEVQDEMADIFHYLLEFADNLGIDLEQASEQKLIKSALKYPVNKAKGKATKYNKL